MCVCVCVCVMVHMHFIFLFQFFSLILFVLTGVELLNAGNLEEDLEPTEVEKYPDAYFVAGSIKAATFVSAIIYHKKSKKLVPYFND